MYTYNDNLWSRTPFAIKAFIVISIICISVALYIVFRFPWSNDRLSTITNKYIEQARERTDDDGDWEWHEARFMVTMQQKQIKGDSNIRIGYRDIEVTERQYKSVKNGQELRPRELEKHTSFWHNGRLPFNQRFIQTE